jgi:hypothetical protein
MADTNGNSTFFSPYPGILQTDRGGDDTSAGFRDVMREVSDGNAKNLKDAADDARHQGMQFAHAQKDRADQDRYLSAAFERASKDRGDDGRWAGDRFAHLEHDVLRAEGRLTDSDRRTELAVEKTSAGTQVAIARESAATNLAIEKTAAATNLAIQVSNAAILLDSQKNAAAAALALEKCCCELKEKIGEDGERTRALVSSIERDALRARLAYFESRVITPVSPV